MGRVSLARSNDPTWSGMGRTSDSNFVNSSSFFVRYSSISFWASVLASFTLLVRSDEGGERRQRGVAQQGSGIAGLGIHSRAIKTSVTCDAQGQKGSYLFEQSSELPFRPAERVSGLVQGCCGERSSSHQVGSECPRSFEQTRG